MAAATIGVPEDIGGVGGDLTGAVTVLREVARHPTPVPVAEVMLAGQVAAATGLPFPGERARAVLGPFAAREEPAGWTVGGNATAVPWAAGSGTLLVVAEPEAGDPVAGAVPTAEAAVRNATNLAGEPRDQVTIPAGTPLRDARRIPPDAVERLRLHAALTRAAQLTGALEAVLAMTVAYAGQRRQFGRPLTRFQAVRHLLALMAAEVTAATTAVRAAARHPDPVDVMTAKIEASRAATGTARIAHQVHGAIGTTEEYPLHHLTARLWSWRDEYGGEDHWATRLAARLATGGGLWQALSGRRE